MGGATLLTWGVNDLDGELCTLLCRVHVFLSQQTREAEIGDLDEKIVTHETIASSKIAVVRGRNSKWQTGEYSYGSRDMPCRMQFAMRCTSGRWHPAAGEVVRNVGCAVRLGRMDDLDNGRSIWNLVVVGFVAKKVKEIPMSHELGDNEHRLVARAHGQQHHQILVSHLPS